MWTFGIGPSPSHHLVQGMARAGMVMMVMGAMMVMNVMMLAITDDMHETRVRVVIAVMMTLM